jgi:predicted PhzF superfamily epimerase YddE/YHI9
VRPTSSLGEIKLGLVGAFPPGRPRGASRCALFVPAWACPEDPVTGSLNAGLAQWLIGSGAAPRRYLATQGRTLERDGRVHIEQLGDTVWVGGDVASCIVGEVQL